MTAEAPASSEIGQLLGEAAAREGAGDRRAAQELYLRALKREGSNIEARFGFARQLLANGMLADGIAQLRRVTRAAPDHGAAQAALGRALRRAGDLPAAAAALAEAVRLGPDDVMLSCDLAACQRAAGQAEQAEATLRHALERCGRHPMLLGNLGIVLVELGRLADAIDALRGALTLETGATQAAGLLHSNLARAYIGLGDLALAEEHYRLAIAAFPDFAGAHRNLGILLKNPGKVREASDHFAIATRLTRASRWLDPAAPDRWDASANFATTSEAKLTHDIEQFRYLLAAGRLPKDFPPVIARYEAALAEVRRGPGGGQAVPLPAALAEAVPQVYNRLVYLAPTPALATSPLNPALDVVRIEADYFANAPGLAYFDDFLTPEALAALRRFCLESTVWFDFSHEGGYLGAYWDDGFCCDLLLQIAEALRTRFPRIFRDHSLKQMWGYKYDSRYTGIAAHADAAAVNVNFWLTPDEANLDPGGGGLEVTMREAPAEWDFFDFNGGSGRIATLLQDPSIETRIVPHRQNRAVMFNSNLVHRTGKFHFKPGYANRRINVTMLFGDRQPPAG